ncbi:phage portal protein [Vagococcus entomophilus]|uniref:Phage portal protein n=1 Tax=Vagococcus entomophilus TaxID=1160095 RepID=A0A430AK59_9ENTE|nr:phage portal protein [Vagococcus entomophilus]RSU08439.1 phage portal protein [Vagococcus entomophilus]
MSKFTSWFDIYKKNSELETLMGLEFFEDSSNRPYIKRMAIDTCINFVARTISQSEFRLMNDGVVDRSAWHYKLNVRPNTDQSATTFWQKVIYNLLFDNEVLIVMSDTDDLLIADSYTRNELALYEDTFEGVSVKGYMFNRKFRMNEVIFLEYNNEDLERYVSGLFADYGELFGRMMDASLRNNQIRGTVEVSAVNGTDEQKTTALQKFIDKVFESFKKSVAIVPMTKGLSYNEIQTGNSKQSFDEIQNAKSAMISEVAKILGIPPALVHGEMADLESNKQSYVEFCINPLLKKIEDELNAKMLEPVEYQKGKQFEVVGINKPDPFKDSEKIDKVISSGFMNINEARKEYGLPPREGGDVYVITKNYTESSNLKGGEEE